MSNDDGAASSRYVRGFVGGLVTIVLFAAVFVALSFDAWVPFVVGGVASIMAMTIVNIGWSAFYGGVLWQFSDPHLQESMERANEMSSNND